MSLRDTIDSLATGTYMVFRRASGTREMGRYQPGDLTSFPIVAVVETVTGRELQDLPEGQRGDEIVFICTRTELKTRTPGAEDASEYGGDGTEPDIVLVDDSHFKVIRCDRCRSFGDVHFEAYAARTDRP